jgi:pimeloyl-ACP methyl ester carboxylesterase
MQRREFTAQTDHGELGGWASAHVAPDGQRVLLLHGGPGLSYGYVDGLAEDIGYAWTLASFQQRGLAPSTTEGPFDVATATADVVSVLDALGWDKATVIGHSWGGHLALHLAVAIPERLDGVLCVDLLGAVGDGGIAEFQAAMVARASQESLAMAEELDHKAMRGEAQPGDAIESLRLLWPSYYADPASAPPMPDIQMSVEAYAGLWASVGEQMAGLQQALPGVTVPMGIVMGECSPMPTSAGSDVAGLVPSAWLDVVPGAGLLPWYEAPGSVRRALIRLALG